MSLILASGPSRDLSVSLEDCPAGLEAMVEDDLGPLLDAIPIWCATLRLICLTDSDERSLAHAEADPEYRQARIHLRPLYLAERDQAKRRGTLAHEIAHLILWGQTAFTDALVREVAPDGTPFRRLLEQGATIAEETATEDVARALMRRLA